MGGGQGALRGVRAHAERRPQQGQRACQEARPHPGVLLCSQLSSRVRSLLSRLLTSARAVQLGTLGAGNHYTEMQVVEEIFDAAAAQKMGINKVGQASTSSCDTPS